MCTESSRCSFPRWLPLSAASRSSFVSQVRNLVRSRHGRLGDCRFSWCAPILLGSCLLDLAQSTAHGTTTSGGESVCLLEERSRRISPRCEPSSSSRYFFAAAPPSSEVEHTTGRVWGAPPRPWVRFSADRNRSGSPAVRPRFLCTTRWCSAERSDPRHALSLTRGIGTGSTECEALGSLSAALPFSAGFVPSQ